MNTELIFHLSAHFFASIFAGYLVWKIWQKPAASIFAAIVGGVFVDLDHFIDYFLAFGFDFKLSYFLSGYQFLISGKDYIFFHGWEYIAVFVILIFLFKTKSAKSIFLGLALGLFFHLVLDASLNHGLTVKTYSLIYRAENKFELKNMQEQEEYKEFLKKQEQFKF